MKLPEVRDNSEFGIRNSELKKHEQKTISESALSFNWNRYRKTILKKDKANRTSYRNDTIPNSEFRIPN